MREADIIGYLKNQREMAEQANIDKDPVKRMEHSTRYKYVYEFLQDIDVLPKYWNVNNPKDRP